MENEQSGFFESMNEFLDTIEESGNIEMKVNGIISLLKSTFVYLESSANISSIQSEAIHSFNESSQANLNAFNELYERVATLEKNFIELASISSELSKQTGKIAETAAKIPVINIDNLLETLNEHAEEINENTASIKLIKNKLNLDL